MRSVQRLGQQCRRAGGGSRITGLYEVSRQVLQQCAPCRASTHRNATHACSQPGPALRTLPSSEADRSPVSDSSTSAAAGRWAPMPSPLALQPAEAAARRSKGNEPHGCNVLFCLAFLLSRPRKQNNELPALSRANQMQRTSYIDPHPPTRPPAHPSTHPCRRGTRGPHRSAASHRR